MSFLTEVEPDYGTTLQVAPGVWRIVARNPSVMTYHGTNTYLIEGPDGCYSVVDPGPDLVEHIVSIVRATGGRVSKILLTHRHSDHRGALPALQEASGAQTYAFSLDESEFVPDHGLQDDDEIDELRVIHTPGHSPDHICLARDSDRLLFSGDHVMGWASSVVSPPEGDMSAYCSNLRSLLQRDDIVYLPGHGPPLPEPQVHVVALLRHREQRERQIQDLLKSAPSRIDEIVDALYKKEHPRLYRAAKRNAFAHLLKLQDEGSVRQRRDNRWEPLFRV